MKKHLIIVFWANVILVIATASIMWVGWYCPVHEGNTQSAFYWWWNMHKLFMILLNAACLIVYIMFKIDNLYGTQ